MSTPALSRGWYAAVCAIAFLGVTAAGTPFAARGASDMSHPPDTGSLDNPATDTGSITTVVRDADDTPGRLDIHLVRSTVDSATGHAARVRYTVRTLEPFRVSALHPRWRRLVLGLDTDGRPGAERNVLLSTRDGTERRADIQCDPRGARAAAGQATAAGRAEGERLTRSARCAEAVLDSRLACSR